MNKKIDCGDKDGRGRPAHVATNENALMVAMLAATGMTRREIAAALGVSIPTLQKYYLSAGAAQPVDFRGARQRLEGFLLARLYECAANNSVAAIRVLFNHLEKSDLKAAGLDDGKLGKKEAARRAAPTAHEGTSWSDLVGGPQPPLAN